MRRKVIILLILTGLGLSGCAFVAGVASTAIGGIAGSIASKEVEDYIPGLFKHGDARSSDLEIELYPNVEPEEIKKTFESLGVKVLAQNPSENKYFVKIRNKEKQSISETLGAILKNEFKDIIKSARRYILVINKEKILKD